MIENLIWLAAGLVIGVVYHAVLQPYVTRAWEWIKSHIGIRKDAP
jgi:hypothetical protein